MVHAMELNYSPALFKQLLEQDKELVEGEGPREAHSLEARGLPRAQIRTTGSAGKSQPEGEGRARRLRPPHGCRGRAGAGRRLQELLGHVRPVGAGRWIQAAPRASPSPGAACTDSLLQECSPSTRCIPHRCSWLVFVNRGTIRCWQCLCSHLLQTPSCHCQDLLDAKLSCQRVENTLSSQFPP